MLIYVHFISGVCKPPLLLVREATHASCDTRIWIMYCVAACVGPTLMFSPDQIERQGRSEPNLLEGCCMVIICRSYFAVKKWLSEQNWL